ncbi:unnamed protein product [Paramecium pentaurelia]|uniref:Uncharacterized protein n=1 Tax=Paramecium pentaurelia TaxID=43138 RepID=A0A8S1WQN2_9CILI|nr:unnamed protein product [Paramecium pentaurelia]
MHQILFEYQLNLFYSSFSIKENKKFNIEKYKYINHFQIHFPYLRKSRINYIFNYYSLEEIKKNLRLISIRQHQLHFNNISKLSRYLEFSIYPIYGYYVNGRFIMKVVYQRELEDKNLNELKTKLKFIDSSKMHELFNQ